MEGEVSGTILFTIILACEKYRHKMLSQDTSMLGDYMYFMGDPELSSPLVKDNIVYLPCPDNYESLPVKTLMAVKWAVENKEFDLILKTDDDVIFFNHFNKIVCDASEHDYSGRVIRAGSNDWHFGKCDNPELNNTPVDIPEEDYCEGPAYFLSKKSASYLASYGIRSNHFIYEDAEIGYLLRKIGIIGNRVEVKEGFKVLNESGEIIWPTIQ
tara:strand:+ start:154 stop:792 length:639 start_codon:yes stop_codon:yes gene_type:complete